VASGLRRSGFTFIKQAQVLGLSLDEIKRVIDEKRAGQSPCAEVRELVRLRLHELDERMQSLNVTGMARFFTHCPMPLAR
jgi:DNA-binding transcriptional MerR regulator